MNTSTTNSGKIMKLKLNCNDIFAEEISDECAYHLTQFFKNLAFAFETMIRGFKLLVQSLDPILN